MDMPEEVKIDPPVKHHFAPGQYAREIIMPAGSVGIGKIHRHAHVNVISQGEGEVATEFGRMAYKAPMTFVSEPGVKRVVHCHTDTVWTTFHVTNETDVAKIEEEVIAPSYDVLTSPVPTLRLVEQ
jgi:hypothetical protein